MTAPRFEVLKRETHAWHVLDHATQVITVIAFPLDDGTVSHMRVDVAEVYVRRDPGVLEFAERKLERRLERAGYRVPVRPPPTIIDL